MIDHTEPPRWVTERGKCSIRAKFDALTEIAERDIEEANGLEPRLRKNKSFRIEPHTEGISRQLEIVRSENGHEEGSAIFRELSGAIEFRYWPSEDGTVYTIFPEWNEECSTCVLRISGENASYEVWQICQRFLGPFIFQDLKPNKAS